MKNKFNTMMVIERTQYERYIRDAEDRGKNVIIEAHKRILNRISGYKERFQNERTLKSADIVFILDQLTK